MLVSWNWLKDYLPLDMPAERFETRLMLAGLNHEHTRAVGDDLAIDLEITSNRPDCLGHIGVAREASVVFGLALTVPDPHPRQGDTPVTALTKVRLDCPNLCYRYTARAIRGAKVKPSPAWMVDRLATIGVAPINNIVDITNYVLMECGQPLHAFDFQKLQGHQLIIREACKGERFEAINHKVYELEVGMCVIADQNSPVALGGVMGGASTEIGESTSDVLIEAAEFDPTSIRATARKLALHSDSSYRFERGVDPAGVDWASRRCCQLMLELAGGELAGGVIAVGRDPPAREPVVLRLSQLKRILGIEIEPEEVRRILKALGNSEARYSDSQIEVIPPSWRRDLTREIDLVEEVARIHGYDAIPEDVSVPMATSARGNHDRVLDGVREALVGAGVDEAMTISMVDEAASESFSPWTESPALIAATPVLRRADRLRRSLVPSLLEARRDNESAGNERIDLFEIARVYLPTTGGLPEESLMLAMTVGGDFLTAKGIVEAVLRRVNSTATLSVGEYKHRLLTQGKASELRLSDQRLGYLGEVSPAGLKQFDLRGPTTVVELNVQMLERTADLIPRATEVASFPPVARDLNLVVDERVSWADLEASIWAAGGPYLETVEYRDTYRDAQRLGPGKKSQLFTVVFRRRDGTLTGAEADQLCDQIVAACANAHGAALRA